jgi:hypothetical protein
MSVLINASTSTGLVQSADTSGEIELQSNGTTALKVNTNEGIQILNCLGVGNATPSTSGAGITFPAVKSPSSDANTLDDYEEGTFTPTITATGSAFSSVTYVTQLGKYTKTGDTVFITLAISWSAASGGSGDVRIGGLPFSASDSYTSMAMYQYINVVSDLDFQMRTNSNNQLAPQYLKGASGVNVVNFNSGSFNKSISVAGCYKV